MRNPETPLRVIARLLRARHWSYQALADETGIPYKRLLRIAKAGTQAMSLWEATLIADVLDVTPNGLITETFEHDFSDIEKHYPTYHGGQTIYLSYKGAPAISVTRDHFCAYVISWESHPRSGDIPERETDGRYRLLVGYEVLDEKAARASNPAILLRASLEAV